MKNPNRILLLAMPRTGSNAILQHISRVFRVDNYGELFGSAEARQRYHDQRKIESGAIKLLPVHFHHVDVMDLVASMDLVIFLERQDLLQCCLSLYFAELTGKYHYDPGDAISQPRFECDLTFVQRWLGLHHALQKTKRRIIKSGIVATNQLYYEIYMQNRAQKIQDRFFFKNTQVSGVDTIATHINYLNLCTNLVQVQQLITARSDTYDSTIEKPHDQYQPSEKNAPHA
jgi:hypothetical protein